MKKPIVAIVGKPNVGKSTLFNALCGEKRSIVDETPGVTRDRIYADCEWRGYVFSLVDTGGIEDTTDDEILLRMRDQALIAIETADVVIFMLDLKTGISDADLKAADILRRSHKSVILSVNKVDEYLRDSAGVYEFYELGMGDLVAISAANRQGLGDLLDEIVKHLDIVEKDEEADTTPRIAVIGRPNVGKSSLVNALTGDERMIVSDRAGTTRDSVDTRVTHGGEEYILVDTAGLRRKSRIRDELERYSCIRAVSAVNNCDIALIVTDATSGITDQDVRIAGIAVNSGKGVIVIVNKWDILPDKDDRSIYRVRDEIRMKFSFMPWCGILFVSAKTGQRVMKIYDEIDKVRQNQTLRIKSGVLNEVITEATAMHEPPRRKGRQLKILYVTQTGVEPPTFVFFVNQRELFHFSYQRYIENQLREAFGFYGTALRFIIRERKQSESQKSQA